PNSTVSRQLAGHLPESLLQALRMEWWPGDEQPERTLQSFKKRELEELGKRFNGWEITPAGTEGYRTAEVTRGGVDVARISSKTMQVSGVEGLYFIGEVLDVTGHLGGFNFQWAWSTGHLAGKNV
ncbi:MAG: aminoacetone oxidase family FAD-binding enzyme, partial [Gammaproteobacteria bacterium]|nr:aminoacetone oxidase family FAD-binding enzyme [Gammaproteobacteria bacterium]